MKMLHAFTQSLVLVSLPLLLGGCGEERDPLKEGFKYSESELNYQHYTEDIGPSRYVAGKAYTGRLYELFDNGELSEEGHYRKGYLNGVRRSWYGHGQLSKGKLCLSSVG
jgi:antitoxin component YwqK of YwqJK toxin-antitoxin module